MNTKPLIYIVFAISILVACDSGAPEKPAQEAGSDGAAPVSTNTGSKPESPAPAEAPSSQAVPAGNDVVTTKAPEIFAGMIPRSGVTGVVKETMGGGGYTYLKLETKHGTFWCAGPEVAVKKGDQVKVSEGVLMENFSSKTLNKTFKNIYFVRSIEGGTAISGGPSGPDSRPGSAPASVPGSVPASAPGSVPASAPSSENKIEYKPIKGFTSVEQVWVGRKSLSGKTVKVRGKAVKVTSGLVGGLNWVHVQDGSGGPGTNDLIVTTTTSVKVGNTVSAQGAVMIDKELGPGVKFDVLIHNAKVEVE
mgnify:CR=1 FL=1